jgi:hypothetical protein
VAASLCAGTTMSISGRRGGSGSDMTEATLVTWCDDG